MAYPKTRILFTENGRPVEGLAVRTDDAEDPVETDADGQVAVPLLEGRQTLRILKGGEWISQVVQTNRESSLIIVDLAQRETGEFTKPPTPDTSFLDIGKLNLGERYVYQEIIGRGGMSVVLRAQDRLLNREVAVKVLSQELQAQPEAQQIFLAEARSLATLSHPNLVSVHDICKVDQRVFMVIEYVKGESLEKLVSTVRGFNETVALQTMIQLARVVGYLHDHDIIHRDIKPANAMLRNDGTVKLIDFGLARHFDDLQVRGTRVRGTPAYMSPEQVQGEPLGPSCDVYQLGVCMFEALTGQLPFSSKGDMGFQHVHNEAPNVQEFRPQVSDELAALLGECLAKDPLERPQNGQALLRRLQVIYQHSGAAGANLYQQLQQEAAQSLDETSSEGYTTEEMRLMEAAGKHLRTSEFDAKRLSDLLSDPDLQSKLIIHTGPRWPVVLGACFITSTVASLLVYALMAGQLMEGPPNLSPPSFPVVSSPAVVTTAPVVSPPTAVGRPAKPDYDFRDSFLVPVEAPVEVPPVEVTPEVVPKAEPAVVAVKPKPQVETRREPKTSKPTSSKAAATAVVDKSASPRTDPKETVAKTTTSVPKPIASRKKKQNPKKSGLFAPKRRASD